MLDELLNQAQRRVKKGTEGGTPAHPLFKIAQHRLYILLEQLSMFMKKVC